jgi:hypothetical protein
VTALVSEMVVAALDWAWPRVRPTLHTAASVLVEAARPFPPMTIRTTEGHVVTGVLLVQHGHVRWFVGTRYDPGDGSRRHRDEGILWPDAPFTPYAPT